MIRSAICLGAGALLSLVIALAMTLQPYPPGWVPTDESAPHADPANVSVDRTRFGVEEAELLLPKEDQKAHVVEHPAPWWSRLRKPGWRERRIGAEFAAGWPMRCLYAFTQVEDTTRPSKFEYRWSLRLTRRQGSRGLFEKTLPLLPLWPGLVFNAVVYGGALIIGRAMLVEGRAALRLRRGECPRCRYDLTGAVDAGCPECGWRRG